MGTHQGEDMIRTVIRVWCCVALLLVSTATIAVAQQDATPGVTRTAEGGLEAAAAWLVSQQRSDGAFVGFTGESDAGTTVDAIIALAAAQIAGVDTGTSIEDAVQYLASADVALVYAQTGVGQAAKLVLSLVAAGEDPTDFAAVQLLILVENGQDRESGIYGNGIFDHGLAILALAATDTDVPETAIDVLAETQAPNGGWSFDGAPEDSAADSNTTAVVIQALVASGNGDSDLVTSGMAYLESTVTEEGGSFSAQPDSVPDANSTALVAQAYIAAGDDTSTLIETLARFQNANGAFFYNAEDTSDNLLSTVQAIPALAEVALPLPAAPAPGNATPASSGGLPAA